MSALAYTDLRTKHPVFRYEGFTRSIRDRALQVQFNFSYPGAVTFSPSLTIPTLILDENQIPDALLFRIGLVEMLSYWKAACSPKIEILAGALSSSEIDWWRDLLFHGLGEFFAVNKIPFWEDNFVTIAASGPEHAKIAPQFLSGDLIGVGGGKDSALALELVKKIPSRTAPFILNPIPSALACVGASGGTKPIIATRTIAPELIKLNKDGYLNGHTPFSALLAFVGGTTSYLNGYESFVVSNESSADEQSYDIHGFPINHQYSKSFRFEKRFREYLKEQCDCGVEYFSLIRSLHDIQVSKIFADSGSPLLKTFRSCNVGQKENRWCGSCAKCAFVYLTLYPFIPTELRLEIFGRDLFESPQIVKHIGDLVGLGSHKPFDCVGTIEESQAALILASKRASDDGIALPHGIMEVLSKIPTEKRNDTTWIANLLLAWNTENFVPERYSAVVRAC